LLHHTLISRFNLATPGREAGFRTRPGWLEERFALFERFCLPSVAAQTCQAFDWIVFFDDQTPDWARETAERLQAVRPFHALYTPLFDNQGWARAVRAVAGPSVPARLLVTSNLDNDDALGFDYVERVQRAARTHFTGARFAVNVPDGYVLADCALYAHRHVQNAFTNLVEPDDAAFATTMTIRHMELSDHVPVVQAQGPAGWLQVVHGGNVSNRIRGRRIGGEEARRQFPANVLGEIAEPSVTARLVEALLAAPARALRDRAFALARRIVRVDRI
jgi:hypothetical protein